MRRSPRRWSNLIAYLSLLLVICTQPVRAGVTEWMDIRVVDGNLMVETEVAGIPGQSIIDTGATITAINAGFLESNDLSFKKGRRITVTGVFGESKRSTYREVPGAIFGGPVTFLNVVDLELGEPDIQLLLGANFFASYVFQFDYTNERMRLITRDSVDLKAIKNVDAKRDRSNGSVVVKVGLNESGDAWMLMDTGLTGGILVERSFANRQDWIGTFPSVDGTATGVISSGQMEYFRLPSIDVGPFKIENVLVSVPAEGETLKIFETITPTGSRLERRNASEGILGYDVLKHFVVTIDYDRGYVHFYPGEKKSSE